MVSCPFNHAEWGTAERDSRVYERHASAVPARNISRNQCVEISGGARTCRCCRGMATVRGEASPKSLKQQAIGLSPDGDSA
jgi:hypothetical protein